jgi:hypothetical protein
MKASPIGVGKPIDQDWKTIDDLVGDVANIERVHSSHPGYLRAEVNEGGFVVDITGLITALRAAGINIP